MGWRVVMGGRWVVVDAGRVVGWVGGGGERGAVLDPFLSASTRVLWETTPTTQRFVPPYLGLMLVICYNGSRRLRICLLLRSPSSLGGDFRDTNDLLGPASVRQRYSIHF